MAKPSRWPTRSRSGRKVVFRSLLTALIATATVLLTGAVPAHATETPAQIEKEIDTKANALEPIIEQYNAVHDKYVAQKQQADRLQAQINPLQLKVGVALARVSGYSTSIYENGPGGTLTTLLNAGTSGNTLDFLGLLDQMASQQRDEVASTVKLQKQYEAKKAPLDLLVAQLSSQQATLNSQASKITTQIAALNKLRLQAYGTTGGTGNLRPVACPYTYTGDAGSKAAAFACKQISKPYVWAASGPNSYDCSGLTMASWASVGVSLPHNAYAQKYDSAHVTRIYSFSSLRPGDLIFYYSTVHHVGIYVGGGWIVNAPQTGEPVQMARYDHFPVNAYGRPHA